MFSQNILSFEILETNNTKTIAIGDTSEYNDSATGFTLQVLPPNQKKPIELSYYKGAITILNSNLLKLTNVKQKELYQDLPDGLYTAKISICPNEDNWFEKSWYRINQLLCKYYKSFLTLDLNKCESCYNKSRKSKLDTIWTYIQGVQANITDCNFQKANELYSVANKLCDDILNCDCED